MPAEEALTPAPVEAADKVKEEERGAYTSSRAERHAARERAAAAAAASQSAADSPAPSSPSEASGSARSLGGRSGGAADKDDERTEVVALTDTGT